MKAPAAFPFPWREVMAFGLGRLRWTPDAFWAASPHEILAAIEAYRPPEAEAPSRTTLDALMQAHPDPVSRDDDWKGRADG
ncbi:phage tail assembly chaperone [Bosea sp. (in: a-proteobacteria)]|uniref:phage tail assembly chaperone n=1 Tax=Bosea sp. (in: a-proteobacteria) TaxID=1871050 RepID=UPI002DDD46D3|nr:phage tail assembly chaperone [Bosea sp. (in: a-proteobacteria)]HEV2513379.1 phage tail assembly chaperone [Bosea sp. (in: a-proteobacteria)]